MSPWTSPRRPVRLIAMVLTGAALVLASAAFAYAIQANQHATSKAQRSASQAQAGQLYGLQLFCNMLRGQEADRDTGPRLRAKLERYDLELDCSSALAKPPVPLGKTGFKPTPKPTPATPSDRGLPGPAASTRSPPPRQSSPSPSPSRSPSHSPSPSPSPVPSVCVTAGPVQKCVAVGASAAPPCRRGRHFARELLA